MSQVVKHVMRNCFFNPKSHNFETSGLLLDMSEPAPGQPAQGLDMVRLFATHAYTIGDFAALQALLMSFGPVALKPCPACCNIVKDDVADGHDLLPLSSLETHKWKLHTAQSVRDMQAYLRAQKGRISKTAYGELETRMGYHYNANSVINDLLFKSISTLRFDWAHTYFSTGLFGKELDAFIQLARAISPRNKPACVTYDDLNDYVASWTFPAHYKACKLIFSNGSMAATMSEQLTVAPVLRLFFFEEVVLAPPELQALHEAARSAALVCEAVETLHCCSRNLVHPSVLRKVIRDHLALHKQVHGTEWWTLKNYLAQHIAKHYEEDGVLFNTFVTERRHQDPKRFARQALKTSKGYNKMLMEELLCQHFHNWTKSHSAGVLNAHPLTKRMRDDLYRVWPRASSIEMSRTYVAADGGKYHAGDAVLLGAAHAHAAGLVWYHVNVDDVAWTCLEVWPVVAACGPRCNKHRIDRSAHMLRSTDLQAIPCYRALPGDFAIVRLPMHYVASCARAVASCARAEVDQR
jgi:hypothetical protein